MIRVLAVCTLLILLGFGYLFFGDSLLQSTNPQATLSSSDPDDVNLTSSQRAQIQAAFESEKRMIEIEAKKHVETLQPKESQPLNIETADHFVTADQLLNIPAVQNAEKVKAPEVVIAPVTSAKTAPVVVTTAVETDATITTTANNTPVVSAMTKPDTLEPQAVSTKEVASKVDSKTATETQTAVEKVEKIVLETVSPAETVSLAPIAGATPVTAGQGVSVTSGVQVVTISSPTTVLPASLNTTQVTTINKAPDTAPLSTPKLSETSSGGALGNLPTNLPTGTTSAAQDQTPTQVASVQTSAPATPAPEPLKIPAASQVRLESLLDDPDSAEEKIYFIHAVNHSDEQGLWGILQHALTHTFSNGIKLPEQSQTLRADIPEDADEKLQDNTSSFLGRVLKGKVDTTYIYNYKEGILGDNPNVITPGQQLIIVGFTQEELAEVYAHFRNRAAQ